jgi:hypothetical protein
VGKGAVINIYNILKALDVKVYKSRCERRYQPTNPTPPLTPKPQKTKAKGKCPSTAEVENLTWE